MNELTDKPDRPMSTVYNTLRQLTAADLVKSKRYNKRDGAPDGKRQLDELNRNFVA